MILARLVIVLLVASLPGARADDLPTPDAMVLGRLLLPRDALAGFLDGLAQDSMDRVMAGRVPATRAPALRTRCRQAMEPALQEAFPPEVLAGLMAQSLTRHLSPEELHALRAWQESAPSARGAIEGKPGQKGTAAEEAALERSGAAAPARKLQASAPAILGDFLDRVDRRLAEVRPALRVRLDSVAEAVLQTDRPEPASP